MEDFYDKLNRTKQGIFMNADAKRIGKERLVHMMRAHEAVAVRPAMARYGLLTRFGSAFVAVFFVAVGTSFAAERSMPGEPLYALKLKFNEKIESVAAVSPEAKADLAVALAEKRLDEAQLLALEGKMSVEAKTAIESNFEAYAGRAEAKIAALENSGKKEAAADASARFESALAAHERVLATLEVRGESEVAPIRGKIVAALNNISATRGFSAGASGTMLAKESDDAGGASADGRITAAENAVASLEKFIGARSDRLSANAKSDAYARLETAETLIGNAKTSIAADLSAEAAANAEQALRVAHETKVLVSAQLRAEANTKSSQESVALRNSSLNFLAAAPADTGAGSGIAAMIAPAPAASSSPTSTPSTSNAGGEEGPED